MTVLLLAGKELSWHFCFPFIPDVLNRDKDEEPTVKQEIEEIEEEMEPQGIIVTRIKKWNWPGSHA